MRAVLLMGLAVLASANSHAEDVTSAANAADTTAPASDATDSAVTADAEEFKPPPGWKARHGKGEVLYCHKQRSSGTRIDKTVCMSEASLKKYVADNEAEIRRLEQSLRVCSNPSACGQP
jgi:hypothetical protein